jgi:hypothetical protein
MFDVGVLLTLVLGLSGTAKQGDPRNERSARHNGQNG